VPLVISTKALWCALDEGSLLDCVLFTAMTLNVLATALLSQTHNSQEEIHAAVLRL
jgi:hypothetical protein